MGHAPPRPRYPSCRPTAGQDLVWRSRRLPESSMSPHHYTAREVVIGPDAVVVLIAAGRGDPGRVDLKFHPVNRVTCEIGGRARPPREEPRFGAPQASTPDVLNERAPGDLLIDSVSEEMGECGEVRFVARVRDERFVIIPVPNNRLIEDRHALFTTADSRTRDVQRKDEPGGDRVSRTVQCHWIAGEDFWTRGLLGTLAGDAEQEGDGSPCTSMGMLGKHPSKAQCLHTVTSAQLPREIGRAHV